MDNNSIIDILKNNNGILSSKTALKFGINNKSLQRLCDSGDIERIDNGLYIDPDQIPDEYFLAQYRCAKCIYSHETALFFHDLTDRVPLRLQMTIPSGYNTRLIKEKDKYKIFYIKNDLHELGKISLLSPYGNEILVYDKERSICECIKRKDRLDTDIILSAIKTYMKEPSADYVKLLKYAEIFKVRDTVKQYLEVFS